MNKNLITAFALSFLVLMIYFVLFPPPARKKTEETAQATGVQTQPTNQVQNNVVANTPASAPKLDFVDERIKIATPLYQAEISTLDGTLANFYLKDYAYSFKQKTPIYMAAWNFITGSKSKDIIYDPEKRVNMIGDLDSLKNKPLQFLTSAQDDSLEFIARDKELNLSEEKRTLELSTKTPAGLVVNKNFTFDPDSYILDLNVVITNPEDKDISLTPQFILGAGNENIETEYNLTSKIGVSLVDTSFEKYDADEPASVSNFVWAGVMSTYFITGVIGETQKWTANFTPVDSFIHSKKSMAPNLSLVSQAFILKPNETWSENFKIYMGPKSQEEMLNFSKNFDESLDLVFDWLARPMLFGLKWFYSKVGNWGIAIMLLTITVRIIIFPLAFKGMKSMKRMQKLTPKMQKIKEKHGNNKEKLNREMMDLYKRNKINPVGGCLPLLLQIPIFIALYWALLPAIELRHQPFFFWLEDLSAMDHTLVLPLLMGVTMFIQQKITPMSAAMDPVQQKIFKFFPILMTFFFVTFPSGLVLYWVTSNVITVLQQLIFNRVKIKGVID